MEQGTLAVLGAGPKALAIAAKAAALRAEGWQVPDVVVVDRRAVAANWTGTAGYTDGRQLLGTPPEKDIGYPYLPAWGASSAAVCDRLRHLSWHAFLIDRGAYAEWVDRGRPRPTHRRWGEYLGWVAERVPVDPLIAEVRGLDVEDGRWCLALDGGRSLAADALVVTGPGTPITLPGQPRHDDRVLDGRTFWSRERWPDRPVDVAVIGNGETAGSVTAALLDRLADGSTVEVVSTAGVLYSRGESYTENRWYSDPTGWRDLAERHRREFLRRTDRGVFSVAVEAVLNRAEGVRTVAGRVTALDPGDTKVVVTVADGDRSEHVAFDLVVVAVGFDPLWFDALLSDRARRAVDGGHALSRTMVERSLGTDLAIGSPKLHLPVLAGLSQGPGFPNLSCLGLLADRVVGAHARQPATVTA